MYDRKKGFIKFNDAQETTFNNPSDGFYGVFMEFLLNSDDDINLGIVTDQDLKDCIEIFGKLNINPGSQKDLKTLKIILRNLQYFNRDLDQLKEKELLRQLQGKAVPSE